MILLDSHVLLWWLADDGRLGEQARSIITAPNETVAVSAVSIFEIETKRRLGKLRAPGGLVRAVGDESFELLPLHGRPAAVAGSLEWDHRDPFDRLLVATSRAASAPLLTADRRILAFEPTAISAS